MLPEFEDVLKAHQRIKSYIHQTPVLTCTSLNDQFGAQFYFKCENFQKMGAFKFRGACNAVQSLTKSEAKGGVATHSSGNHGTALALVANMLNIPAYVVMPQTASEYKKKAVKRYGAEIVYCKPTLEARETTLNEVIADTGAHFIPSYNDRRIIAGQGTACLELLNEISELDLILAPVGGGGLLSGTALAAAHISPHTQVLAAEPKGADDAYRSLKAGKIIPSKNPDTIADGLLTSLGTLTFPIIQKHVKDIILIKEETIVQAMCLIWERMKIIVETSSAVAFAAVLEEPNRFKDQKVGIILSGGNVDLFKLPWNTANR